MNGSMTGLRWGIMPTLIEADRAAVQGTGRQRRTATGITVIDRWRRIEAPANVTLIETIDPGGFAPLEERSTRLP